jgi:hypothetical protein
MDNIVRVLGGGNKEFIAFELFKGSCCETKAQLQEPLTENISTDIIHLEFL